MRQVGGVSVVSTLNQQNTLRATIGFLPSKGPATSSEVGVHFFDMFVSIEFCRDRLSCERLKIDTLGLLGF